MKLGIITAMHGRAALTALWAEHSTGFGLPVFAAITEGDWANIETAKSRGIGFVTMPNEPVGDKMQAALDLAMGAGCDASMILGSDDFISRGWIELCVAKLRNGANYLAPSRIAIHDPARGTYILEGTGKSCGVYGAGRCISRAAIEHIGPLWVAGRNRALDSESHGRILAAGFKCEAVRSKLIPVVDVKNGTNIWPWRTWRGSGKLCVKDEALHMLTDDMRERIMALGSAQTVAKPFH